jgi:hypothetical protein
VKENQETPVAWSCSDYCSKKDEVIVNKVVEKVKCFRRMGSGVSPEQGFKNRDTRLFKPGPVAAAEAGGVTITALG